MVLFVVSCFAMPLPGSESADLFDEGLRYFSESRWDDARSAFEELVDREGFAADALFWSGRSHFELGAYDRAVDRFSRLIEEYPDHPDAEEARYQIARARYRQADYEAAIVAFERFVTEFPDSDFAGNALYWAGESLMTLGRYEQARVLFERVVEEHPRSYRVEAAEYRMELIELGARERELLDLLRWSSEEQLRLAEELARSRNAEPRASSDTGQEEDGEGAERDTERRLQARERDMERRLQAREREIEQRLESVRLREEALELLEDFSQ